MTKWLTRKGWRYYVELLVTAVVIAVFVWVMAGIIVGLGATPFDASKPNYNCWTCLENCGTTTLTTQFGTETLMPYCVGAIGEVGYDVGTTNAVLFLILGILSAVASTWMLLSIFMSKRLRKNVLALLLACMAVADMLYAAQYAVFAIVKLNTKEYPFEPQPTLCSALGFISHFTQVVSTIFYIGFSVTAGILLWDPFAFRKLKNHRTKRVRWVLLWTALAWLYAFSTGLWGILSHSIGVTVDGSCWISGNLEWSFHILVFSSVIYSLVLVACMAAHTVKEAHIMGQKYAIFIMAYILYNCFWAIFTLSHIKDFDHPQSSGWLYALLETVTVILQVAQGFINAAAYYFALGRKQNSSSDSTTTPKMQPIHTTKQTQLEQQQPQQTSSTTTTAIITTTIP